MKSSREYTLDSADRGLIKSPKIDKNNEIELISENDFFEFFVSKSQKCNVPIPSTFLFQEGKFFKWLYYSEGVIKMKKSSKLDLKQLYDFLNDGLNPEKEMIGELMSPNKHLNELLILSSKPQVAIVRTTSFETLEVNPYELRKLFEERINDLRSVQSLIKTENNECKAITEKKYKRNMSDLWKVSPIAAPKKMETYYCKFRRNFGFGSFLVLRKIIKVSLKSFKHFFIES